MSVILIKLFVSIFYTIIITLVVGLFVYWLLIFSAFACNLAGMFVLAGMFRSMAYGLYDHFKRALSFITGGRL